MSDREREGEGERERGRGGEGEGEGEREDSPLQIHAYTRQEITCRSVQMCSMTRLEQ